MEKPTLQMYSSKNMPTWCPSCGDFQMWMAIKKALVNLGIFPHEVLFVFDVGCNGNMADKIGGYRFHSLHGRVVPAAMGACLANRKVKVIAFGGDGGVYGEGVNHLLQAFRSNYDFTLIVHNNGNYGLTTGQATPTTPKGQKMSASPYGVVEDPLDPIDLAYSMQGTFIAREFSQDIDGLVNVFEEGIKHKGFSFIDIIQSCPTYDQGRMYDYFHERKIHISEIKGYDNTDYEKSRNLCWKKEVGIPVGVLYKNKESISFYDRLPQRKGVNTELIDEVQKHDIKHLLSEFQ